MRTKMQGEYQNIAITELVNGEFQARVNGNSMSPCLRDGDLVIIEAGGKYQSGDILVFRMESGVVAHRYLGNLNGRLILKGDARWYVDPGMEENQIVGVVQFVIRNKMRVAINNTQYFQFGWFLSDIYWKIYRIGHRSSQND